MASNKPAEPIFVNELAEKYKCSICTGLLETPVLTECCGQHFCKECLEKWLTRNNTCPQCRANEMNKIVDKPLLREINELKVHCQYKRNGCKAVINYSELQKHERDCPFEQVECTNKRCKEKLLRKHLEVHLKEQCEYRIVNCELCKKEGEFREIEGYHAKFDCPEVVIDCYNECGKRIKRKEKNSHSETCPLERVDCSFIKAGCRDKLARKDLEEHEAGNIQRHLSLTMKTLAKVERAHLELKTDHDTLLSVVSSEIQSTKPYETQVANIAKCIEPMLAILKPGEQFPLSLTQIESTKLLWLTTMEPIFYNFKRDLTVATPSFFISGYPGCRVWVTYPLVLVLELINDDGDFPPEEVTNKLEITPEGKEVIKLRDKRQTLVDSGKQKLIIIYDWLLEWKTKPDPDSLQVFYKH